MKTDKLIIIGDSAFAEVAYEYFTHDSQYEVVGFAVERAFLTKTELFGLPVHSFEALPQIFADEPVSFYAALVYTQLNRLRARLYQSAKDMGFKPASYISSKAFVWPNARIGEHCFIMEDNTVQPFVSIGDNVVLWSGNHIGHHGRIHDHVFVSSHVVVSGFCEIGAYSFLGVNATIGNNVTIAQDNWLGPNVTILSNTEAAQLFRAEPPPPAKVSTLRFFKVPK
ncbi:MAG: acetyltransferase [Rhodospirillaceae bacterium]